MDVRTLVLEPEGARPVSRDPALRHFPGLPSSGSPGKAPGATLRTQAFGLLLKPLSWVPLWGSRIGAAGAPQSVWGGEVSPLSKFSRRKLQHVIPKCSNP